MRRLASSVLLAAGLLPAAGAFISAQVPPTVEFIFMSAPFPSVHASTIAETRDGLVTAWFGGTREGASDVGIWVSRQVNGKWTPPIEVGNGVQADGTRHPSWNPVLFELRPGELTLFYKVGPSPREWWGMARTSKTAAAPGAPRAGCPTVFSDRSRTSQCGCPTGPSSRRAARNRSIRRAAGGCTSSAARDGGATWDIVRPPADAGAPIDAIQPSILTHADGTLQALGRSRSGTAVRNVVARSRSNLVALSPARPAQSQRGY
jgi:hypothetical protein